MKLFKKLSILSFAFILTLGLSACFPHMGREVGQYVDDATITTKVKTALLAEKNLKSTPIGVETSNGVVQLSGFVSSQQAKLHAMKVAKKVKGVKKVIDSMTLKEKNY